MSTAKTVGRGTTIVKVSNEAAIQKKPNQEIVQRGTREKYLKSIL